MGMAMRSDLETEVVPKEIADDPDTGRPVWRISPRDAICVAPYMYIDAFTPDERHLFYAMKRGEQGWLCRYELETGETVRRPLSRARRMGWGANLDPAGRELFVGDEPGIVAIDFATFAERVVVDLADTPYQRIGGPFMFTGDGRRFTAAAPLGEGRSAIVRVMSDGSGLQEVYRYTSSIQHLQQCPGDDDLITFCQWPDNQNDMAAPPEERARTMLLDLRTGEARPWLMMPRGFRATHEFWSRDGSRLFFHKKTQPGWIPNWLCWKDRVTGEEREFYRDDVHRLGHSSATDDQRHVVTDGQDPGRNPLILVEVSTGRATTVCWPNASIEAGHPKHAHVHPIMSPRGSFVAYTSDAGGTPQVYVAPVDDLTR